MEINEQNISHSIYFDKISSSFNQNLRKNAYSDYFFIPSEIIHCSKNFVLILSDDGKLLKISQSLSSELGYSDDELICSNANRLLISGEFSQNNNISSYYFESEIKCKDGMIKKITWRLIPNLIINGFVYIGWKL